MRSLDLSNNMFRLELQRLIPNVSQRYQEMERTRIGRLYVELCGRILGFFVCIISRFIARLFDLIQRNRLQNVDSHTFGFRELTAALRRLFAAFCSRPASFKHFCLGDSIHVQSDSMRRLHKWFLRCVSLLCSRGWSSLLSDLSLNFRDGSTPISALGMRDPTLGPYIST